MLSRRSKILVIAATLAGFLSLLGYTLGRASWASEPDKDWYVQWVILAVCIVVAVISIMFDCRRDR